MPMPEHQCNQHVVSHPNRRESATQLRGRRRKGMKYTWTTKYTCGVCGRKLPAEELFANPRSVLCAT